MASWLEMSRATVRGALRRLGRMAQGARLRLMFKDAEAGD